MSDQANNPPSFADQFSALRNQYTRNLGEALEDLSQRVSAHDSDIPSAVLEDAYARLHKLAGSGGTFGFHELTIQARALELTVKTWLKAERSPEPAEWQVWRAKLLSLHEAVEPAGVEGLSLPQKAPPTIKPRDHFKIVVVDDDEAIGAELRQGLSQFGYEVTSHTGFETAGPDILADPPDILVVDVMLSGHTPPEGTDAIAPLFEQLGRTLPVIFMTSRTDLQARLAAVQAGGDVFVTKPADAPTMAGHIEALLRQEEELPYKILIVDDDEPLAEHYRLALSSAGMTASKLTEPLTLLEEMHRLHPDLVLMDLHMPECSGADLAQALRYDEAWQTVPIVFLSAEEDVDLQVKAMVGGGDDFMTKPISMARLIAVVRARARRARQLTELMSQDSLTGLLKHASIKERLIQEASSAQRRGSPLAVAMVDIDLFKTVNDDWGHPMGDQVIKTLGNLLRQCLRRQDSVGRYGGEEFAAILPDCTAAAAFQKLDDIRRRFSEIRFVHQGESFGVTISVGIASSEEFPDAQGLLSAADLALYKAKRSGRNQVCVGALENAGR